MLTAYVPYYTGGRAAIPIPGSAGGRGIICIQLPPYFLPYYICDNKVSLSAISYYRDPAVRSTMEGGLFWKVDR